MFRRLLVLVTLTIAIPVVGGAAAPTAGEIVDRMIAAAGGQSFANLGVVELAISEEETKNDGSQLKRTYTAYVDAGTLKNLRLELPGNVVLGQFGDGLWATKDGVLDGRPQTPRMVAGTLNQRLFPLLLPFSLKMEGVSISTVQETSWEGRDAWLLSLSFSKGFFSSPVLNTTWETVVAKDDASILAVEFVPSPEYRKVQTEGIRYQILKFQKLGGANLGSWFLLNGISVNRQESGHVRVTKVAWSVRGPWEPALFMNPKELEVFDEEE